jgi:hypothetical protein
VSAPLKERVRVGKSRKHPKPWAIEWRVTSGVFLRDWQTLRRYRTQIDAERALAVFQNREKATWSKAGYLPSQAEFRLISPSPSDPT